MLSAAPTAGITIIKTATPAGAVLKNSKKP